MSKVLKIDDDKIALAISVYKKYLALLTKYPHTDEELSQMDELWSSWYKTASTIVENKNVHYLTALILGANENHLTVEAVHNCIEILGMNITEE